MWIFIAVGSVLFYGFSTVLDNFLTNRLFKSIWTLVFFGFCFDILFLPFVFFLTKPQFPPLSMIPIITLVGFLEVAYLLPYYKALQNDDTSVVTSLFSLGRVFVPAFAFLIVGEVLRADQYLGFFLIILSSALLTLKDIRHFRFNKSFFYMLLVSVILALDTVLYKYILGSAQWSGTYISVIACSWLFSLCFLFHPVIRKNIWKHLKEERPSLKFLALEEFMNVTASLGGVYVLSLVPVTLARGISSITPFVVLFYGAMLQKFYPQIFHENIERKNILKKLLLFVMTVIGVYLIVRT